MDGSVLVRGGVCSVTAIRACNKLWEPSLIGGAPHTRHRKPCDLHAADLSRETRGKRWMKAATVHHIC
eukprot:6405260-Amphidinium_carterae.2